MIQVFFLNFSLIQIQQQNKQQQQKQYLTNLIPVNNNCKHVKNSKDPQLNPTLQHIIQAAKEFDKIKKQQYMQEYKCNEDEIKPDEYAEFDLKCTGQNNDCPYKGSDIWLCLSCMKIFGGISTCKHALFHFQETNRYHSLAMNIKNFGIWCFKCQCFVNDTRDDQLLIQDLKSIFIDHKELTQWSKNQPINQEKIQQPIIQQKPQNFSIKTTQQPVDSYCQSISEQWQDFYKYDIKQLGKITYNNASCYAVSIVHMLAHIDCFSNYFINFWAENIENEDYEKYQFTSVLAKYILYSKSPAQENSTAIEPNELVYAINQLNTHLKSGTQQDANEFLTILFEHLTYRCKCHADVCFQLPVNAQSNTSISQHLIYVVNAQQIEEKANAIFANEKRIPYALLFVLQQEGSDNNIQIPEKIKVCPQLYMNQHLDPYEATMTKQQLTNNFYLNQMAKSLSTNIIKALYTRNNIEVDDFYFGQLVQFLQFILIAIQNQQKSVLVQIFEKLKQQVTEDRLYEIITQRLLQESKKAKQYIRNKMKGQLTFVSTFINYLKESQSQYYYNFENFDFKMFQSYTFRLKSTVYYQGDGQSGHYITKIGDTFIDGNNKFTAQPQNYHPYIFAMERENNSTLFQQVLHVVKNQTAYQTYEQMCQLHNFIVDKLCIYPQINTKLYYRCPSLVLYYLCQLKQIPNCDYKNLITDNELVKYSFQPFQDCGFIKINAYTLLFLQGFSEVELHLQPYLNKKDKEQKLQLLDSIIQNQYENQQVIEQMPYILSIEFLDYMKKELLENYQGYQKPANYDLFEDKIYNMQNIKKNLVEQKDYVSITSDQEYQLEKYYQIYPIEKLLAFQYNDSNLTREGSIIESNQE